MAGTYFSGKDAYLSIAGAGSNGSDFETLLSDEFDVTAVDTAPTTDRFTVKPFRAIRAVSIAGHTQELWTIKGPTTIEAIAFFEPMANTAEGKAKTYTWGPYGNTTGLLQFTGTLDVLDFVPHATVSADGVPEFSASVSILTKTAGVF